MKTRIIYTSPNGRVLTYTTEQPVKISEFIVEFFDEVAQITVKLPLDRCQVHEVA